MPTMAVTYRFFLTHNDRDRLEEAVEELDSLLGRVVSEMEEHCGVDAKQVDTQELTDEDDE